MSGAIEQPAAPATEEEITPNAAFTAGFEEDDDQPQPTATLAPVVESKPEPTATPAPEPKFVQITEEEWNSTKARAARVDELGATFDKKLEQVYGKVGTTLERKFAELQKVTPQGEAVSIDDADFAELKEQYPELGELTVKGLNKVLSKIKGTGTAVDPAAIDKMVDERVAKARAEDRQQLIDERLEEVLPNWKQEVKTDEFKGWISSQKGWDARYADPAFVNANLDDKDSPLSKWVQANPDEPVALYMSRKASGAERMLKAYAGRKAPAATPSPAPAAAPTPAPLSIRQRQLAAAVPPKADAGSPPSTSGKSPFQAGFEEDD